MLSEVREAGVQSHGILVVQGHQWHWGHEQGSWAGAQAPAGAEGAQIRAGCKGSERKAWSSLQGGKRGVEQLPRSM